MIFVRGQWSVVRGQLSVVRCSPVVSDKVFPVDDKLPNTYN